MRLKAFCPSEMFCVAQFCPYGRRRVISRYLYGAKGICADSNGPGENTSLAHLDQVLPCEVRGQMGEAEDGRTQPGELGVFLGLRPQHFREFRKQISTVLWKADDIVTLRNHLKTIS